MLNSHLLFHKRRSVVTPAEKTRLSKRVGIGEAELDQLPENNLTDYYNRTARASWALLAASGLSGAFFTVAGIAAIAGGNPLASLIPIGFVGLACKSGYDDFKNRATNKGVADEIRNDLQALSPQAQP